MTRGLGVPARCFTSLFFPELPIAGLFRSFLRLMGLEFFKLTPFSHVFCELWSTTKGDEMIRLVSLTGRLGVICTFLKIENFKVFFEQRLLFFQK